MSTLLHILDYYLDSSTSYDLSHALLRKTFFTILIFIIWGTLEFWVHALNVIWPFKLGNYKTIFFSIHNSIKFLEKMLSQILDFF